MAERVINATPHAVVIVDGQGNRVRALEPSGLVIRRAEVVHPQSATVDGIPTCTTSWGALEDLPGPESGTFYIVSRMVKDAAPERDDLLVPAELVRDERGRIIGCRSLSR